MDSRGLEIRTLRPTDIAAGMRLKKVAKWNQTEQDWIFLLEKATVNLAAKIGERIVGTVTDINYSDKFHWIGMVLVDPSFRRKGIATRLMKEVISLHASECPVRLDATPEGKILYDKLGFILEQYLSRYQLHQLKRRGVPKAEINCRQANSSDLNRISVFDSGIFGADRSEVLEYLMNSKPPYAWVAESKGKISGYCMGRPGSNCDQLGPVVAKDQSTAESLLLQALKQVKNNCVIVDSYDSKKEWNAFLIRLGFQRQRTLIRMYAGDWQETGHPEYQFAVAGPELG